MTDIARLLEQVQAATGPDRELDREIAKYFGLGWDYGAEWPTIYVDGIKGSEPTAYPYTASVDVALALVEHKLHGWHWSVNHHPDGPSLCGLSQMGGDHEQFHAIHNTSPALAILAALLSALSSGDAS